MIIPLAAAGFGLPILLKAKANILMGFVFVAVLFAFLFGYFGYYDTWRLWSIRPMEPHFADLRVITGGAESYKQGYDPMIYNPGDPWQRKLNYPRVWQSLYSWGVDQSYTTPLGLAMILLFLVGVYLFLPRLENLDTILVFLALISPAVLLGVERGNIDLIMFFLLALAVIWAGKYPTLSVAAVLLAFVLKLFPIFGLAVLLRRNQAAVMRVGIISFVFVIIYVALTYSDLVLVRSNTPSSVSMSYGVDVFGAIVTRTHSPTVKMWSRILSYLGVLGIMVWTLTPLWINRLNQDPESNRRIDAFRVGSSIYVGTFVLGANWDYRLVFLLFTLPQLLAWTRHQDWLVSRTSALTLIVTYASLWHLTLERFVGYVPHTNHIVVVLDQMFKWLLFAGLLCLFSYSMPAWMQHRFRHCFPTRRSGIRSPSRDLSEDVTLAKRH